MYRRILIGYLDTGQGRDALALGTLLAQASRAELILATARTEDGESLAELARRQNADLVVLGSSHRGDVEDVGMRVVGVGFDGTRASAEALKAAVELALPNGAALRVYTVARKYAHVPGGDGDNRGPGAPTEAEVLREMLHEAVADLPSEARALPVFLRGFAAQELVEASEAGVDIMVLGSRGGGPLRRRLHHSVTGTVMQDAKCPVLISPTGVEAPTPALA